MNTLKTFTLLAALGGLLIAIGGVLGGTSGMVLALIVAIGLNGVVYWKSDSIALRANGAREPRPEERPRIEAMVSLLAERAGIPMPRIYVVDSPVPNAFATGRDPSHAAVAVTTGIMTSLDDRQLAGVLAHELSHVKNRDTLIGTIAATVAGAISFLAQMAQFQMIFGGGDDDGGSNPIAMIGAIILAPIAALLIQMAVSRGREYAADSSGVSLTGDPEGLAQALETIDASVRGQGILGRFGRGRGRASQPAPQPALNPAFAHLYIANPLSGGDVGKLFSTHPPIRDRVERLRRMRVS